MPVTVTRPDVAKWPTLSRAAVQAEAGPDCIKAVTPDPFRKPESETCSEAAVTVVTVPPLRQMLNSGLLLIGIER